ncbi:DUF4251 domain-containing protein [Croceitalea sp. P059]|uniref:DUF4251 domain-containing protein n=1 Tax=Croceitalea sp. P059 TaxID=3075601 RepID=UPI002887225E|nr:DUF4251 domain-containing protein [Croceitalea sp. P059]MDT0539719.1 DUF4251 domain-containing protein [Croceitalea sp. P059]
MKKTWSNLILLGIVISFAACSTAKKTNYTDEEIALMHKRVESKSIYIDAKWASPLATQSLNSIANAGMLPPGSSINRIDLYGTSSFLEINGDSVSAELPYYGERQIGGAYNSNNVGINFDGKAENMNMTYIPKRNAYVIEFSIANETEVFNINAVLFPNNNVAVNINSSQRLTIKYQGVLKEN